MRNVNLLSVVIPCHNEQEILGTTHERLTRVMAELVSHRQIADYELVYVDNGSTDTTLKILEDIFGRDARVRIAALRCNFGYQGSISAGLAHARGDAVVTVDADLQDPPEKIGEMIQHFQNGFDLVLGIRQSRQSDSFVKRVFAQGYYRFLQRLQVQVVYNHGDFRLMARALVDEFNRLPERNRFIRAMILKLESRYATVAYDRVSRQAGRSKFDVPSLFSLSMDGITSFSYAPLRLASLLGVLMCVSAVAGIIWVVYIKITTNVIPGWASIMLPLLIFNGFQLLILGLIGEYIGRLYIEVKQRPLFVVRKLYER